MKIKVPFNFIIGIICSICFCTNIVKGRDAFMLLISGFAAVSNIAISFMGER